MNNKTNELDNKTNELNIYDVAIRMVPGAKEDERSKISILADEIRVYIESQAEVGLLSDADLYYIVNSILSETIDVALEWEGSTGCLQTDLRAAVVEPIERAYKAAIESLVEDMRLDGLQ